MRPPIGTIIADATTAKTNGTTATPFANTEPHTLANKMLIVQPDVACFVAGVSTSTEAVTSATGTRLEANGLYECPMDAGEKFLSALAAGSGTTVNLKVFLAPFRR